MVSYTFIRAKLDSNSKEAWSPVLGMTCNIGYNSFREHHVSFSEHAGLYLQDPYIVFSPPKSHLVSSTCLLQSVI